MEKFAKLSATEIKLHGERDKPIVRHVTITPRKKYPFKIVEVKLPKDAKIKTKLTEKNGENGPYYDLMISNNTKLLGYYLDTVTLKTDSPLRPELFINVSGRVYVLKKKG